MHINSPQLSSISLTTSLLFSCFFFDFLWFPSPFLGFSFFSLFRNFLYSSLISHNFSRSLSIFFDLIWFFKIYLNFFLFSPVFIFSYIPLISFVFPFNFLCFIFDWSLSISFDLLWLYTIFFFSIFKIDDINYLNFKNMKMLLLGCIFVGKLSVNFYDSVPSFH